MFLRKWIIVIRVMSICIVRLEGCSMLLSFAKLTAEMYVPQGGAKELTAIAYLVLGYISQLGN